MIPSTAKFSRRRSCSAGPRRRLACTWDAASLTACLTVCSSADPVLIDQARIALDASDPTEVLLVSPDVPSQLQEDVMSYTPHAPPEVARLVLTAEQHVPPSGGRDDEHPQAHSRVRV
jgi:hypothetical protein